MNIYEKLQSARVQLQDKKLKKTGKNKFAGFDYYELSDFLPAINVIFNDLKMSSIFCINDNTAILTIINAETPEEKIDFKTPTAELELKGCNAIQALGGVHTYCRRYLYQNALEIVENDMFDSVSGKDAIKQQKRTKQENIDPDFDIIEGAKACNSYEEFKKYYKEYFQKVKDKTAFNKIAVEIKTKFGKQEAETVY